LEDLPPRNVAKLQVMAGTAAADLVNKLEKGARKIVSTVHRKWFVYESALKPPCIMKQSKLQEHEVECKWIRTSTGCGIWN
jgi:hypothetical protein